MTITSSGNVGIGTSAPTAPLHVYGASGADAYVSVGPGTIPGTDGLNLAYGRTTYAVGTSFLNAHSATGTSGKLIF